MHSAMLLAATSLCATNDVGAFQLEVFDDVLFDKSKPVLRKSPTMQLPRALGSFDGHSAGLRSGPDQVNSFN
jgi:hypothetical protein